jgi:hypothetical protein
LRSFSKSQKRRISTTCTRFFADYKCRFEISAESTIMDSTQLAVNEGTEVVASGPAPAVLNQQEVPVTTAPEISTIPAVEGAFVIPSALTILAKQFLSPVFGNMTMDHLKATMRSIFVFFSGLGSLDCMHS